MWTPKMKEYKFYGGQSLQPSCPTTKSLTGHSPTDLLRCKDTYCRSPSSPKLCVRWLFTAIILYHVDIVYTVQLSFIYFSHTHTIICLLFCFSSFCECFGTDKSAYRKFCYRRKQKDTFKVYIP